MSHLTDVLSADTVHNGALRHAIDCLMEGVALLDAVGLYTYMNPAHAAMYGFAPDELIGKSWRELYEPTVIATIEQHYFPILLAEGAWRGELVGRTKQGAPLDVEISLTLLEGAQGEPTGLVCTCRDISERKQAEQALKQSEERHELAIRAAHLGVFEHDHRMDTVYWSPTMRQIYGVGPDTPPSFDAYIASIHPDDRASTLLAIQRAHAVDGDGRYAVTHRIVRPDGIVRWVSIQSQTYFEKGGVGRGPLKTMGVMADVTEQETAALAAERLAAIVSSSQDAIVSKNLHGVVTSWNQGAERLFGYSAEEMIGQPALRLIPPDRLEEEQQILASIACGKKIDHFETLRRRKDGTCVPISVTISPVRDTTGTITGASKVARDITERKQAELALQLSEARLELANNVAGLGMYDWNPLSDSVEASPTLNRIFGLSAGESIRTTEQFLSLVHSEDRARVFRLILRSLSRGEGDVAEYRIVWPDGSLHWLLDRFRVFRNERGRAIRILGTVLDITSQKEAVALLRRDQADLERRVAQRTKALTAAMEALQTENRTRRRLEAEQEKLFLQVQEGQSRLQALSRNLLSTQETERQALARDLHDEVGQALTAVKSNLLTIQHAPKDHTVLSTVADSVGIVDQMLDAVRSLALDLRPSLLDDLGLVPTLRWYFHRQLDRFKWKGTFRTATTKSKYEDIVQIACFRVAQEALTNVVRHAKANRVSIRLCERKDVLTLTVRDNGVGFDLQRAHRRAKQGKSLGLVGMEERVHLVGGAFHLTTTRGTGTVVQATFPLAPEHRPSRRRRTP